MFEVVYHYQVVRKDIPNLPSVWREKIKIAIEEGLVTRPEVYGKPLRRSLKGYRKLRVGNYRVIFRIERNKIFILIIQHRSVVYKSVGKRK